MRTLLRSWTLVLAVLGTGCDSLVAPDLPQIESSGLGLSNAPHFPANGAFVQTALTGLTVRQAGPVTILEQTSVGLVSGTLSGTYTDDLRVVIQPDGRFNAQFTIRCECVMDGRQGIVEFAASDRGEITGPTTAAFAGRAVITSAGSGLSGLHGVLRIEGTIDLVSGLSSYTYSGRLH